MFSYEDEPQKLENASAGRLKVSQPALHCPTCASRMISYVRGKRKISIPFCPIHGHDSLEAYSNLYCNAFRNDAVRHFEAENYEAENYEAENIEAVDVSLMDGMAMPEGSGAVIGQATFDTDFTPFSVSAEDDPDFDPVKADRNKDGEISSWERTVGNAVAKSMREQKKAELTGSEFYPVGEGRIIGSITGDSQFSPLGANAEEDVKMQRRMKAKKRTQDRKQARRMKARKYENMAMAAEYASPYGERQTTDFGMVGGGNDFGQNRAEMMEEVSQSMSGGRMGDYGYVGYRVRGRNRIQRHEARHLFRIRQLFKKVSLLIVYPTN